MAHPYDLIIIGGGAAGLTAAGVAANLGARAVLIEQARLGGDCTWTGCVPSKTLLKAAHVAHQLHHADRYGLTAPQAEPDFGRLMRHVRAVREAVYEEADAPPVYEAMGVEVRTGRARFVDAHTVAVATPDGTEQLSGRYVVVATGARAAVPPLPGLAEVPYLTSETLFELERRPQHLGIIGAGPIGTEMAQAFRRLGAEVTVLDRTARILGRDDAELADQLRARLAEEGVTYLLQAEVTSVARQEGGVAVTATVAGRPHELTVDALLVATGRTPHLADLQLDAAGVAWTPGGIPVDDRCRTNQKHIFAAGDVTDRYRFTHMSEHMAKVAVTNALLKLPMKIDAPHVPWVTYTDPELAHVGATEADLQARGTAYEVYAFPYTKLDRAVTDGEPTGRIKVYAKSWNGRILGADILGARAGEMICEYALAMRHGITLRQISDTIHPYPTYGLGVRRAADQWYVRKQSPLLVRLLQKVFGYRGPVNRHEPGTIY